MGGDITRRERARRGLDASRSGCPRGRHEIGRRELQRRPACPPADRPPLRATSPRHRRRCRRPRPADRALLAKEGFRRWSPRERRRGAAPCARAAARGHHPRRDDARHGRLGRAQRRSRRTPSCGHPRHHGHDRRRQEHGLSRSAPRTTSPSRSTATADAPSLKKYRRAPGAPGRALVVDDDPAMRDVLRRTAGRRTAGSVAEAAQRTWRSSDVAAEQSPTLILLDLMMPEMDGFEFIDQLRESETAGVSQSS